MNRKMWKTNSLVFSVAFSLLFGVAHAQAGDVALAPDASAPSAATAQEQPRVQLAILLDTSNSMDGLINQARAQLWRIVNEFLEAKRNGMAPRLEVAIFEYGNSRLPASENYLRQVLGLSDDLDKVSEELFALTTNGGDEYCGAVIQEAIARLAWSASNDDLKLIFIAGNEPFTQGPVDFRASCRAAIEKGITVNTLHCGPEDQGRGGQWQEGAVLADGRFLSIDQSRTYVHVPAPQDDRLGELNNALNGTYIPFGEAGEAGRANQRAQDGNSSSVGKGSFLGRTLSKSSANYCNDAWDLVDACNNGKVELAEIKEEDLPEPMRGLSAEERAAYVEAKRAQRTAIQEEIKRLAAERQKFVAEKQAEQAGEEEKSLDEAVVEVVREEAKEKGFELGK